MSEHTPATAPALPDPGAPWIPYRADWVAHGVRWTDDTGAIRVHATQDTATAPRLASMLRVIQAERGAVADAGVVIRQMSGDQPIGEWVAAPWTGPDA
ncbi:hypothetical protein [Nocardia neocaledoniensis]|uniref:hypothetical protein n=1 Tax=Nocardia neocaledoniensis TaxID=236511 RepID=UPI002458F518|nr:hypothetical protein [Nocardia neocaledoniensis]